MGRRVQLRNRPVARMSDHWRQHWQQTVLFAALTLVLVGFFMTWLDHGAAGLSFIGLEMGEQAKFLPQVRSGEIIPGRSLFYLPPITVALILALITVYWPQGRWQTWVVRFLAIGLSLLAFPAYEALGTERAEWLWRVLMIGLVVVVVAVTPLLRKMSAPMLWLLVALIALCGAFLPTWVFFEVRAAFSMLLREPVGIGCGVWANLIGHLLIAAIALGGVPGR